MTTKQTTYTELANNLDADIKGLKAASRKLAKASSKAAAVLASPMPTVAAPVAPQAPAATRGMPVAVRIGAPYRCAAAHNMQWWQALQAACAAGGGQAELAPLLAAAKGATAANPGTAGAPGHFVGYALRKGYLVAVGA